MGLSLLLPLLGAFLIGLSKAGFAAGLGMLTTPLMAAAIPARMALGAVLPLLCLADLGTMIAYRRDWSLRRVLWPLAGAVPGIAAGMLVVGAVSERGLRLGIGSIGLALLAALAARDFWYPDRAWRPPPWIGILVGAAAGFSSTLAHAAGPIMALYLLAQKPAKAEFVGANAAFFTLNNLMKVPPYLYAGLIHAGTLKLDLLLAPAIPLGVAAGWLANRHLPQRLFDRLVYMLLFLTSLEMLRP